MVEDIVVKQFTFVISSPDEFLVKFDHIVLSPVTSIISFDTCFYESEVMVFGATSTF